MSAILKKELTIAEDLIRDGVDVNAANKDGVTALMFSLGMDQPHIATLLVANGANVHAANKDNVSALMIAIGRNHKQVARLLIEKGADVVELSKTYPKAKTFIAEELSLKEEL